MPCFWQKESGNSAAWHITTYYKKRRRDLRLARYDAISVDSFVLHMPHDQSQLTGQVSYVGEDDSEYFRSLYGRRLNNMNHLYSLPADQDEVQVNNKSEFWFMSWLSKTTNWQRSELHHRMMQFVFSGRNYVGPVREALQFGQHRRGQENFLNKLFRPWANDSFQFWISAPVLVSGTFYPCEKNAGYSSIIFKGNKYGRWIPPGRGDRNRLSTSPTKVRT